MEAWHGKAIQAWDPTQAILLTQPREKANWNIKIIWTFRLLNVTGIQIRQKSSLAKVRIWPFALNKKQSNEKYTLQNLLLVLLYQECLEDLLSQDHPASRQETKRQINIFKTQVWLCRLICAHFLCLSDQPLILPQNLLFSPCSLLNHIFGSQRLPCFPPHLSHCPLKSY